MCSCGRPLPCMHTCRLSPPPAPVALTHPALCLQQRPRPDLKRCPQTSPSLEAFTAAQFRAFLCLGEGGKICFSINMIFESLARANEYVTPQSTALGLVPRGPEQWDPRNIFTCLLLFAFLMSSPTNSVYPSRKHLFCSFPCLLC